MIDFPDIDAMLADMETPEGKARIRARKLKRYAAVEPFLMNNWPAALWELSFGPNMMIPFPAMGLVDAADGHVSEEFAGYFDQLDTIIAGKAWFIRLNSRSPKDASYPDAPIVKSGDEAFTLLTSSMRAFDDCADIYDINKPCFLVLRAPINIPPRYEFRCFVKGRELVGITQYFYDRVFDGLEGERTILEPAIRAFHQRVNDIFPQEDYVFDVFFDDGLTGPTLIEVNPYGLSDPCLFGNYKTVEQGGFLTRSE